MGDFDEKETTTPVREIDVFYGRIQRLEFNPGSTPDVIEMEGGVGETVTIKTTDITGGVETLRDLVTDSEWVTLRIVVPE